MVTRTIEPTGPLEVSSIEITSGNHGQYASVLAAMDAAQYIGSRNADLVPTSVVTAAERAHTVFAGGVDTGRSGGIG